MYSIKRVSELLNIPTVTIRAWENRYNIISPTRSKGGHRLYSQEDIETLKWLKAQTQDNNMKISEAVRLLKQSHPEITEVKSGSVRNFENLIDQLYQELIELNSTTSNTIIDLAFSLYDYEEVFHNILVPVLYRIGDKWESGDITIAQEHFSSQFVMQRCTQFLRILPINQHLPKVLAFCPEGEHHHIGLMLFSLFLRKKGLDVIYLGPNTPFSGLTNLIEMKNVSIVAISITNPKSYNGVLTWMEDCLQEYPDIKFVIGGLGIHDFEPINSPSITDLHKVDWEEWYQTSVII
ncbi:MerR family transcriptional regulator [Aquibacillus halophilus]|uniref:MerR family transcriptional regulator n=1 Tax=Aquibacillus halophilus TaxID=930132 RepID=A0A6A8DGK1_9BACI|nr:MerR family transcriptional regulator [Aquibacillus halophilus]MRH44360.1 MerR family transcriptional regulator [Aquibacillus halophilus]